MTSVETGVDCTIDQSVQLGYGDFGLGTTIGDGARIRAGSVIYGDVRIGDEFVTGHDVLVREGTRVGDDVLIGSKSIIDGNSTIGSNVSIQSRAYIPTETIIGDNGFIGPGAVLTNDAYPLRREAGLQGPVLEEGVSIGGNATILPGVTLGENAFVAAGAVVTEDVPANRLAIGVPATHRALPNSLERPNHQ